MTDDRAHLGPFKFQQLFGSPAPPWRPIGEEAVRSTLEYLKAKDIHYLAPSAHDTCDWSLHAFEEFFGDAYYALKVGELLTIGEI